MKIFLSYSTVDRWIAQRISNELTELGATTFLDRKDITTGDSINTSLKRNLAESDELVLLLSPASLTSEWVLIELGGAIALNIRVAPILCHVGPNDLPSAIGSSLARDINNIDEYYEEVRQRLTQSNHDPTAAVRSKVSPGPASRPPLPVVDVGSVVKIASPTADGGADRPELGWNSDMSTYVGAVSEVVDVNRGSRSAHLAIDGGRWFWAFEWLVPWRDEDISEAHS